MNRRQVLKWGGALGALTGIGAGASAYLLPPRRSRTLAPVDELARRLFNDLAPEERALACVDYDHPLRQVHNRGVNGDGLAIRPWSLARGKRGILVDLFHAGLSEAGRARVPDQFFVNLPGVHLMSLLICGDPNVPPYQLVLTAPHLNLRLGGTSREGVAFGGPQVYGDQRGNGVAGLPGNRYRYQCLLGQELFANLAPEELSAATIDRAPIQTQIEVQGHAGSFPGAAVAEFSKENRARVRALVDGILSTYRPADVAYAHECIAANSGLDALHVSTYRTGEEGRIHAGQVFRIEGPGTVLYFRGFPHVHAFVNVARDAEQPLSVGEELGRNPTALAGASVARFFERALRDHEGTDLAYYPQESVAGRLRAGTIRSGDLYVLESWRDDVAVVEVQRANLNPALVEELFRRGEDPPPGEVLSIATTAHAAANLAGARLGRVESVRTGAPVRAAAVAYAREHGFSSDA